MRVCEKRHCKSVCVCVREREREGWRERSVGERERQKKCVYVRKRRYKINGAVIQ